MLQLLLLIGLTANANALSFFPKNNLHLQDDQKSQSNITEEQFNQIIDIALDSYQIEADDNNERLKINNRWSDSTVNANVRRFWGTVTINMYGGLARREEIVPDGFALVLCHELGHAYGGAPYLRRSSHISAEGQADYYGARKCLSRVYEELPMDPINDQYITSYIVELCQERVDGLTGEQREKEQEFCERSLVGAKGLGDLLALLQKEDLPEYDTPDSTVVDSTQLSYPRTVQCRLDTYKAGALNQGRPLCWYNPDDQ